MRPFLGQDGFSFLIIVFFQYFGQIDRKNSQFSFSVFVVDFSPLLPMVFQKLTYFLKFV